MVLEGLGFTELEESIYRSILDNPPQTVRELTARLEVSAVSAHSALRSLEKEGLILRLAGRPSRYAAVSPDAAIERLAEERLRLILDAREAIPQLMARFHGIRRDDSPSEQIEILTDHDNILRRWGQLLRGAQEQIRALDRPPYILDPYRNSVDELAKLQDGLTCRVIYDQTVVEDPRRWPDIEDGIRLGEQARMLPGLPIKLTIFDDQVAVLALRDPAEICYQVHFRAGPIVGALAMFFELLWENASPLDGAQPGLIDVSPMSPRKMRLLSLLAAGFSDDALGRALGVSRSTVQREVRELMDHARAKTRFQAGVHAGRCGWLRDAHDT